MKQLGQEELEENEEDKTPENTAGQEESEEENQEEQNPSEEPNQEIPEENIADTTGQLEEDEPEEEQPEEVEELPEQVISSSISSENASIYKGYFYANIVSEQKYETAYNYTENIEVQESDFIDEIYVEEEGDKFVFDTEVELKIGENTYYKQTLISEEEFKNVLGEEGLIEIYSTDGELVGTINSKTESIDGIYVFNYDVEISKILIKIINPVNNGKLNIKHIKAIKSELEYTRKQVELFRNIQTIKKVKAVYEEENVWENESIKNLINLEETESRMDLEINTNEFSTMLENQVTFNVTLKTNEERYDLFQNPTIEIIMPSAIEEVEITSVNLLYKNGLSLSSWEVVENTEGKKVIKVSLEGNQTEYTPGSMQEGTTLVIYTKIDVNKLTSNTKEKIKMTYKNENSSKLYYEVNGKEAEEVDIEFVSKEGILKSNSLLNFNGNLDGLYGFNDEVLIGSLDVESSKKTATVNMAVVNNYSKELEKVSILGRIPSKGIEDGNGNELGTTIDTILLNAINYSGVSAKIYYSPKIDASIDDESWEEQVADYGLIKSYKIEIEKPMKQGDRAEFGYSILIPEDLKYNEVLYSTYQVNYYIDGQLITEVSSIGAETEKREIVLEDCKEQTEYENVTVGVKVTKGGEEVEEGEEIFERQILRYTAVVKNTTSKSLKNVKIKGKAANSNLYYLKVFEKMNYGEMTKYKWPVEDDGSKEYEEIVIEELKPDEELRLEYQAIVQEVEETEEEYVFGEIYISSEELEEMKIETSKHKIKQAKISLKTELGATETMDDTDLFSNAPAKYCITIKNISNENLENINLNILIPEEMSYDPETHSYGNNELKRYVEEAVSGKKIVFEIPILEVNEEKEIFIVTEVNSIDLNLNSKKMTLVTTTQIGEDIYVSNDYTKIAHQNETDVEVEYSSNLQNGAEVKDGDEIIYNLKLKNIGILKTTISIRDNIPYGLDINEVVLIEGDKETKIENATTYLSFDKSLDENEEIELTIKTKVNKEKYLFGQEYIENSIEITGNKISKKHTDVLSFKIIDNINIEEEKTEDKIEDFYTEEELKKFEEMKKEEEEAKKNQENNKIEEDKTEETDKKDEENIEQDTNKDENKTEENTNKNEDTQKPENTQKPNTNNNSNNNSNINQNVQNAEKGKYSITGKVWIDLNKNGRYETEEKLLPNIEVRLYKSSNGSSVVYSQNNLVSKIKTNSEGKYEFSNLEQGYYLVMAEYDTNNYNLAEYKVKNTGETSNSDFINKTTTIDGNKKTVAISDILQIKENNIGSIDLGLTQKDETDIEIKKSISTITVEDNEKKETIKYNEDNIVKLEIAAKKLGKTKVTIMYEFEIKNKGDIDTYVTNIADYLPEGLEFNEKNNSGWYKKDDNTISNLSLVNTKIEPGKTKRLKLALTANITDDTLGSYINKTEVLETTNEKQIKEANLENNKGQIELLITIKTGEVILYVSIIILIIVFVALGIIYLIKKKKINFKIRYK